MKTINNICMALALGVAAASFVGCAGNDYDNDRTTGEYIDDRSVTLRVKDALDDNTEFKFDDVNVTSYRGHVQLSGFVVSDEQKDRAEEIARTIRGVTEVDNKISIRPEASSQ